MTEKLPKAGDLYVNWDGIVTDVLGIVNKEQGMACGEYGDTTYVSIDGVKPYNLTASGRTIWIPKGR